MQIEWSWANNTPFAIVGFEKGHGAPASKVGAEGSLLGLLQRRVFSDVVSLFSSDILLSGCDS